MNILDKIVEEKRKEVSERKELYPTALLEKSLFFENNTISMKDYILRDDKFGIIAEFKRKSPSKGMINEYADIEKVSIGYMQAGASALSVLTDEKFFGGSSKDLITARKFNFCPILRKDFIIDEYQIIEAKSIGADVILLIAAILTPEDVMRLAQFAKSLKLEILLELHDERELEHINQYIDLVGINNRNLKDFSVDTGKSIEMAKKIPNDFVKVAESGISKIETILNFRENGFRGFLMGERFMQSARPELACKNFIAELKKSLVNSHFANNLMTNDYLNMKLKVCGMKHPKNIMQLIEIQPDYIGFIFYPKSKRYVGDSLQQEIIQAIPASIKKVGVFVNESIDKIKMRIKDYQLDFIQLHGDESAKFCKQLSEKGFQIIKAFQVHKDFDFTKLDAYKAYCKYFLFDTQTPLYGGSGHKFDWQLLKNYDNEKSFFLSGGIDFEDADKILDIKTLNIHAIDINSKFEIEPGLKNIEKIKRFKNYFTGTHGETQRFTEI